MPDQLAMAFHALQLLLEPAAAADSRSRRADRSCDRLHAGPRRRGRAGGADPVHLQSRCADIVRAALGRRGGDDDLGSHPGRAVRRARHSRRRGHRDRRPRAWRDKGEAGRAFGAGFVAAAVGGIFGAVVLALAIPLLQPIMLAIGSPELLGVQHFRPVHGGDAFGPRAAEGARPPPGLGLMISMIGSGTQTGTLRWTFDWLYLFDGVPLIPVTLGLFALPELADLAINRRRIAGETRRQCESLQPMGGRARRRPAIGGWCSAAARSAPLSASCPASARR